MEKQDIQIIIAILSFLVSSYSAYLASVNTRINVKKFKNEILKEITERNKQVENGKEGLPPRPKKRKRK